VAEGLFATGRLKPIMPIVKANLHPGGERALCAHEAEVPAGQAPGPLIPASPSPCPYRLRWNITRPLGGGCWIEKMLGL